MQLLYSKLLVKSTDTIYNLSIINRQQSIEFLPSGVCEGLNSDPHTIHLEEAATVRDKTTTSTISEACIKCSKEMSNIE
jgi:hypothetical protein